MPLAYIEEKQVTTLTDSPEPTWNQSRLEPCANNQLLPQSTEFCALWLLLASLSLSLITYITFSALATPNTGVCQCVLEAGHLSTAFVITSWDVSQVQVSQGWWSLVGGRVLPLTDSFTSRQGCHALSRCCVDWSYTYYHYRRVRKIYYTQIFFSVE